MSPSWSRTATASATAALTLLAALVVTGSRLAVIPLIVAFIALQRHWKAGLTAGSGK
ncbi:hypothetical protein HEK616_74570 [Streptomyces nigrescens]|uniref:Uncharacterized protein n=1 Tax=Streptomyces nigrescens TaxID=1920 RepID=A0ABN6RA43_STRNI|nr:hypothetical protein HEK616_74570 [Streptomyces nigrescens]